MLNVNFKVFYKLFNTLEQYKYVIQGGNTINRT